MRARSVCTAMVRERREGNRTKKRSQSVFPQDITEVDEPEDLTSFANIDLIDKISSVDIERSASINLSNFSGMTTSRRLEEVEKRRKLRKEKRNRKRATVMVTSGAMTFLVMAATLVMATFLMSPTIEKLFGGSL